MWIKEARRKKKFWNKSLCRFHPSQINIVCVHTHGLRIHVLCMYGSYMDCPIQYSCQNPEIQIPECSETNTFQIATFNLIGITITIKIQDVCIKEKEIRSLHKRTITKEYLQITFAMVDEKFKILKLNIVGFWTYRTPTSWLKKSKF